MKEKLTIEKLVTMVRAIAFARPETYYLEKKCQYAIGKCSDGTVGCLFGQAFKELKVKRNFGANAGISLVIDKLDVACSRHQREWCSYVQHYQDHRNTWGDAIHMADTRCKP